MRNINPNQIQQADFTVLVLEIANQKKDGRVSMSELKDILMPKFGKNIQTKTSDPLGQVIGNIISNRHIQRSMFSMGYATYDGEAIEITEEGKAFLDTVPR